VLQLICFSFTFLVLVPVRGLVIDMQWAFL
jgi:hypothetical protein